MINFMTLSEVCTNIVDCPHESPEWLKEGVPVIRNFNLVDGQIDLSDDYYVDEETYKKRVRRAVPSEGDIIFSREAPIGNCAIIPHGFKCCLGQRLVLLRVNKDICSPEYLLTVLLSDYVKKQIEQVSRRGSIVSNFNISDLGELLIPIIDNQEEVSSFATMLSKKITNNKLINAELEAMARTIYDYWFLQFDFPDENGKPYKSSGGKMVWNEELKREIPESWEAIKLGDIFDFVKGKIPNELFDFQTEELDNYLTIEAVNTGTTQYCNSNSMVLTDGEVLMVMDGAASSEVYVGNKGVIGSTFCKLKIKRDYISNNLLYLIMKKYEDIFKKVNTGSTVPHANKNYINDFYICMPKDIHKRKELQKVFEDLINKNSHMKKENQELSSLRDFLLPLLMNGQVGFKN